MVLVFMLLEVNDKRDDDGKKKPDLNENFQVRGRRKKKEEEKKRKRKKKKGRKRGTRKGKIF